MSCLITCSAAHNILYYVYALFQMLDNVITVIGSSQSAKLLHYCKFRQNDYVAAHSDIGLKHAFHW